MVTFVLLLLRTQASSSTTKVKAGLSTLIISLIISFDRHILAMTGILMEFKLGIDVAIGGEVAKLFQFGTPSCQ